MSFRKLNRWAAEFHALCEITKLEPQAVYTCFPSGYKHKFNYYMRTIPGISKLLKVQSCQLKKALINVRLCVSKVS